jgi:hypothetical protein
MCGHLHACQYTDRCPPLASSRIRGGSTRSLKPAVIEIILKIQLIFLQKTHCILITEIRNFVFSFFRDNFNIKSFITFALRQGKLDWPNH